MLIIVTILVLVGVSNNHVFAIDSTTTTVTPNPATVTNGSSITFTVTVADTTNASNTLTGTILISDNGAHGTFTTASCILPTSGCITAYTPAANSSAVTINATYTGDTTHSKSAGTSTLTVSHFHPTSTTVTPSSSSINSGTQITFTAAVLDTSSSPTTPSGNVTWSDGNAGGTFSPASCKLPSGGCTTTYTSSINSPTFVTITASYAGDSSHAGSGGISSVSVKLLHRTTVTIIPNPATLSVNGTVKFIVKVNDSASSPTTPLGTISWIDSNAGGQFNVTSCTLSSGSCASMYAASGNPPNIITINATYSGDNTHSSSSAISHISTNVIYPTKTVVTPSSQTFTHGSSNTFTAVVTDTSNPSAVLVGIVSWNDNGAGGNLSQNACNLSGNRCSITYIPASNSANIITVTASYVGDTFHSGSYGTSSISLAVSPVQPPPSTQPPTTTQPPPVTSGQNNTKGSTVPEFPTSMIVLLLAIASLVAFSRTRIF